MLHSRQSTLTALVGAVLAALVIGVLAFVALGVAHSLHTAGSTLDTPKAYCMGMTRHHDRVFGDTDACTSWGPVQLAPEAMPWTSNQDARTTIGVAH